MTMGKQQEVESRYLIGCGASYARCEWAPDWPRYWLANPFGLDVVGRSPDAHFWVDRAPLEKAP